jgi:cephalosporin hydroxylase
MSSIKQFLPLSVRNALRPIYRSLTKKTRQYTSFLRAAPQDWKTLRDRMKASHNSAELYRVSQETFGVLQQEPEITQVLDYIAAANPSIIGEIGLKHSGNSFLFTQKCPQVKLFVGLDLKLENVDKLKYVAPTGMQFQFFEGSSYAPETVRKVQRFLNGRKFDFLFIDGDHSFHGVKEDFLEYLPMVRPGGLVGFHDIVPDDVARYGTKPEDSECYGGEVYAFWAKLKPHFEHREFVRSWDQTGFGIGIIKLPSEPLSAKKISELRKQLTLDGKN